MKGILNSIKDIWFDIKNSIEGITIFKDIGNWFSNQYESVVNWFKGFNFGFSGITDFLESNFVNIHMLSILLSILVSITVLYGFFTGKFKIKQTKKNSKSKFYYKKYY